MSMTKFYTHIAHSVIRKFGKFHYSIYINTVARNGHPASFFALHVRTSNFTFARLLTAYNPCGYTQDGPAYKISLMRIKLDPAGMHCPAWDDAFVSSLPCKLKLKTPSLLSVKVSSLYSSYSLTQCVSDVTETTTISNISVHY